MLTNRQQKMLGGQRVVEENRSGKTRPVGVQNAWLGMSRKE